MVAKGSGVLSYSWGHWQVVGVLAVPPPVALVSTTLHKMVGGQRTMRESKAVYMAEN